jgi:hypothetical protein
MSEILKPNNKLTFKELKDFEVKLLKLRESMRNNNKKSLFTQLRAIEDQFDLLTMKFEKLLNRKDLVSIKQMEEPRRIWAQLQSRYEKLIECVDYKELETG